MSIKLDKYHLRDDDDDDDGKLQTSSQEPREPGSWFLVTDRESRYKVIAGSGVEQQDWLVGRKVETVSSRNGDPHHWGFRLLCASEYGASRSGTVSVASVL